MNTILVNIGILEFSSKKEAVDYTRTILEGIGKGIPIDSSHPTFNFFDDLLMNHSDRPRKVGCGLKSFGIQQNARDPKCLETFLLRTDGTKETFSWKDCAGKTYLTPEQKRTKAYRAAIEPQINLLRKKRANQCVACGKSEKCSVDHKDPTFYMLMKEFETQTTLSLPTIFDKQDKTNCEIFTVQDKVFEDAWTEYHASNAVLQLLCDPCHKLKTIEDNKKNAVVRQALVQSSEIAQPVMDTSFALG
jgi:5-methylcytosine-specific restriction endonuclease McrA